MKSKRKDKVNLERKNKEEKLKVKETSLGFDHRYNRERKIVNQG